MDYDEKAYITEHADTMNRLTDDLMDRLDDTPEKGVCGKIERAAILTAHAWKVMRVNVALKAKYNRANAD